MGNHKNVLKIGAMCLVFEDPSGHSFGEWMREQDVAHEWLVCGGVQADDDKQVDFSCT